MKTRGKRVRRKQPAKTRRKLPPTLGRVVSLWIERCLVHSKGDYLGQPFRLRPWQRRWIYELYELDKDGNRTVDSCLIGLPKGNGKTEFGCAIALAELAGPVEFAGWAKDGTPIGRARTSPEIPVAAGSLEQSASLPFAVCKLMVENGPLWRQLEVLTESIARRGTPGELYPVSSNAKRLDGYRPSFILGDELHEWDGPMEAVQKVLSNARVKRTNAWELNISTCGRSTVSLLGRLYAKGKLEPKKRDPRFRMYWHSGPAGANLKNKRSRRAYLKAANPALGDFLNADNLMRRYDELGEGEEHTFRRYFGNEWATPPERWLPIVVWDRCADRRPEPPADTPCVLGFDGSQNRDCTALVGCTLEAVPHLWLVRVWERPDNADEDWQVPVVEVEQRITEACDHWDVRRIGCDPHLWQRSIQELYADGLPIEKWPSHQPSRIAPAARQFEDALRGKGLTQDGSRPARIHVENAIGKEDRFGRRPVKVHQNSPQKIDILIADIIAFDLAVREGLDTEAEAAMPVAIR